MGVKVRWNDKAGQFYLYVNHQGRRKAYATSLTTETAANARKAEKLAQEKRDDLTRLKLNLPAATSTPTLAVFAETWLTTIEARCKTTTINIYRREFKKHINPRLGTRPVDTLTKLDCQALIQYWRRTGLRTATLRVILGALCAALTDAGDYLPRNPALGLTGECKQPDEIEFKAETYTPEEVDRLFAVSRTMGPAVHTLTLIGLRAGPRFGELAELRWKDFDFDNHRIAIERARNQQGKVTGPKHGSRYVDMNAEIATYLRSLPTPADRDALVCCNSDGKFYKQGKATRVLRNARTLAGLKHIRLHDMRHTFASQLLAAGVPIHYVSKQLGHATIDITVDLYGHLVPGANREWMDRLATAK